MDPAHAGLQVDISEPEISGPAPVRGDQAGLADALRERTRALHTRAERTGLIREIVRGRATRFGYALFLRNLLPAYIQLERGLRRCRRMPGPGRLALPEVYRANALVADLEALYGLSWNRRLPLLPAGDRYARQVAAADQGEAPGLIGHAYTRYLGDLNGGQILKRLLAQSLNLTPGALSFYDFPKIRDMKFFKAEYRSAIDLAGLDVRDTDSVLDAAAEAFQLNIDVSEAVQRATTPGEASVPLQVDSTG